MSDQYDVTINWVPYQLRPQHPPEGVAKPPDTPDNPRVGQRMKAMGAADGINFTGKCDRSPNTLLSHVLMVSRVFTVCYCVHL